MYIAQAQQQRNQLGLPAHLPPMPTPMPPLPAADAAPADPTRPSAAEEQAYENYFDVRASSCSDAPSEPVCHHRTAKPRSSCVVLSLFAYTASCACIL